MIQDLSCLLVLYLLIHTGISDTNNNVCEQDERCIPLNECRQQQPNTDDFLIQCDNASESVCCPLTPPENMASLLPQYCGQTFVSRLLPAEDASMGEFPWIALLGYKNKTDPSKTDFLCTGSLISKRYVLTAAHCAKRSAIVSVRLGEHDLAVEKDCEQDGPCADAAIDIAVENVTVHKRFNTPYLKNDIALIRLEYDIVFTDYVKPICLPIGITVTGNEVKKYQVAGWDTDNRNKVTSDLLQRNMIPSVNISACNLLQTQKVKPINEYQLCAGGKVGYDVCRGDSGGPLMDIVGQKTYVIGIISFGTRPCGSQVPSVATRVTSYLDWITSNLLP